MTSPCPKHTTGAGPCYCEPPIEVPFIYHPRGHATFDVLYGGDRIGTAQSHPDGWYASYEGYPRQGIHVRINRGGFSSRHEAAAFLLSTIERLA